MRACFSADTQVEGRMSMSSHNMCKPVKSILDRSFRYTPSGETDLSKTFARFRREEKQTVRHSGGVLNVLPIRSPSISK